MPEPSSLARSLRLLWLALSSGVGVAIVIAIVMRGVTTPSFTGDAAEILFYVNAAVNIGAIALGFMALRRLETRLLDTTDRAEGAKTMMRYSLLALTPLETSALLACVVTVLTGDLINVAFVVPFFAFARLFWPSDPRVEALLSLVRNA